MEYEVIIGLETHVQLQTNSKIFCGANASYGGEPNEYVDPVTLGLPGALPVPNKKVIEYAIMMGLATQCDIKRFNVFARKHYYYPDLPKGYQISQYKEPICENGQVKILVEQKNGETIERVIGITRIHMEEDAGKNIHDTRTQASLIDLNRAGVALLEIVTEPDLRSPQEASAYMKTLRQLVRFLGVSDGNMDEGSLRCDANISLRPVGTLKYGTRTEIKNLNSFKFVEKALEYEIARQTAVLKSGKEVIQQTLLYDSETNTTRPMRGKEESADYRYFQDPDLPPIIIGESWIEHIKSEMPMLPSEAQVELVEKYGLSEYDANILTAERANIDYFRTVFDVCKDAKLSCNWITSELFGLLNQKNIPVLSSPVSAKNLGVLISRILDETISGKMAKTVFLEMFESGLSGSAKSPDAIIKEKGLKQITDTSAITSMINQVFEQNKEQLAEYLGGNERLFPFFVGQVMKLAKGSASPAVVNETLKTALNSLKS